MTALEIAEGFSLPLEAATETIGILAVKRAGKSNAAVKLAEEMYRCGIPWVAIDPKGDWWGVRADGDGKSAGLSVLVFGGLHGDVPLEPSAGRLVADLIVEKRLTSVLDVSEMSKADQRRFLTDFALQLYRKNREPLHVFCEEADEYIPQRVMGETAKLVGAFETLVKRGGFRGLGITLITQRSASLNKDVLTQVGTLVMLRTTSPQDQKAVEGWIKYHAGATNVLSDLSSLKNGEAWVYSPSWLEILQKVQFKRRETFDSGATPKMGVKVREPVSLAEVDVAAIKEAMQESVERASKDDPALLRKRIVYLENEVRRLSLVPAVPKEVRVEVPVIDATVADRTKEQMQEFMAAVDAAMEKTRETLRPVIDAMNRAVQASATAPSPPPQSRIQRPKALPALPQTRTAPRDTSMEQSETSLGKRERAILSVLAQFPEGRNQGQIAVLTGYSPRASTIGAGLSNLRKLGYVTPSGQPQITPEGMKVVTVEPLPKGDDLLHFWLTHSSLGKRERQILELMVNEPDRTWTQAEVAEETGYSPDASTIGAGMSKLRKLGLVDGWRLHSDFREAVGL